MIRKLYRKGTSNDGSAITGKINAAPTAGEEEKILVEECFTKIDGAPIGRRNSESTIRKRPFEEMELSVVPAGNPRNRDIHRCKRYCFGCRHWPLELLCLDLLRQYDHSSISKEIRWNYLTQTFQRSGTPMEPLPEDEYKASSNVCSVSSQPGGCIKPLNGNDRMVTFKQDILSIVKEVREARSGPLCISDHQEDSKILQLVPGPSIYRSEHATVQLGSPEDETRADNNDLYYTRIDIFDLVPGNFSTFDLLATNSTSNRVNPRSEKRKVPAHQ
ncbi:hypothetical protein AYI68_g7715 [Smittium mucronatum]|uniref:Uncharacterized protein n=1 Tax=Smittium mucronatum TaxID=133383 RepID=A0A1R0GMW7_9FUNG|nr:hypothetical protein AYI68_g7715 [Smittium mucronatum]